MVKLTWLFDKLQIYDAFTLIMNELGLFIVFQASSWDVDLGYEICGELTYVSCLKVWSSIELWCGDPSRLIIMLVIDLWCCIPKLVWFEGLS